MRYLFLHAFKGSPDDAFLPWLRQQLQPDEVVVPQLPNPAEPNIAEQAAFLLANYRFDEETVIVTHSLGGVLAMKLLPQLPTPIAKLVMVAPPLRTVFLDGKQRPALERATDWQFDFAAVREKARELIVMRDVHDHIVPQDQPETIARELGAKLVDVMAEHSHFDGPEEPSILALLQSGAALSP